MIIIILILFWVFYLSVFSILIYQIALYFLSNFTKKKAVISENYFKKFIILIPAYREGESLIHTIEALKQLNYPSKFFKTILLNDESDQKVIEKIKENVEVINLNLGIHSKAEALKKAIPLVRDFDFVVILDADNLIHPNFLNALNQSINSDTLVIQGLRMPKNLNTLNEKLDSITDFVYNQFDRLIASRLGLTGTLSGSGFAIQAEIFTELISKVHTPGGFDKILQSELLLKNIPIKICPDAIVFDEKISEIKSFVRQRRRWLYYHFYTAIKYSFKLIIKGLVNLNYNQIHLGLVSLRPPISLLYFISIVLMILSLWISWLLMVFLFTLVLIFTLLIIKILQENKILSFKLVLALPSIFFIQVKSLRKISEAKKDSLKTEHIAKERIENLISKEK